MPLNKEARHKNTTEKILTYLLEDLKIETLRGIQLNQFG